MFQKENRANTAHGILLIVLFSFAAFYISEIPSSKTNTTVDKPNVFLLRITFSPGMTVKAVYSFAFDGIAHIDVRAKLP